MNTIFLRDGRDVFLAYSASARGLDGMDVVETIEADGSTGEGPPETVHTIESVTIFEE